MTPEALAALHAACFPDAPWSAGEFHDLLAQRGTILHSSGNSGFLLARNLPPEAEILTIAVHPEARRRGIARALVNDFLRDAAARGIDSVFLEVAAGNDAALGLYRACGFAEIARRADYYRRKGGPNEDAAVMRCDLT
ncbi:ribosomal protein S18-alanine N-acetyltransferase [Thalassococcus sp. CAU 1522]|uniref:[Ribosomal protein bS18]-alanine N-acetyltransferase n=1 Tax=Thalassococcus arenae TaxID=2851652 RepID=A0ABS6N3Z6_9RHOB|nr:ribosomal protein S18-alanine N-acetyltransferase [Thalassococcus arenae]MBV2358744.1 ribosomal protein S18-alanine N-acetyltransferase [Thalassococcus arenae]